MAGFILLFAWDRVDTTYGMACVKVDATYGMACVKVDATSGMGRVNTTYESTDLMHCMSCGGPMDGCKKIVFL